MRIDKCKRIDIYARGKKFPIGTAVPALDFVIDGKILAFEEHIPPAIKNLEGRYLTAAGSGKEGEEIINSVSIRTEYIGYI